MVAFHLVSFSFGFVFISVLQSATYIPPSSTLSCSSRVSFVIFDEFYENNIILCLVYLAKRNKNLYFVNNFQIRRALMVYSISIPLMCANFLSVNVRNKKMLGNGLQFSRIFVALHVSLHLCTLYDSAIIHTAIFIFGLFNLACWDQSQLIICYESKQIQP